MSLPDLSSEFTFQTSRSGGAGGQNVNKVSSKVELRFHPESSQLLEPAQKERILQKLAHQFTSEGYLQVIAQTDRSQLRNKQEAVKKLYQLLEKALRQEKVRKPTKPSAAAKQRRLEAKKHNSERKSSRSQGFDY